MQPHEQRVVDEKSELDLKIDKLGIFLQSSIFISLNSREKELLSNQFSAMVEYSKILGNRIYLFRC